MSPFDRRSKALADEADRSFKISVEQYQRHQLPAVMQGPGGRTINKPAKW
jgi:hypothetical protein